MDDLTYTLRALCLRNRDGSHATQADRLRALVLMSRQLREDGFRQMRATSLKGKTRGRVDCALASRGAVCRHPQESRRASAFDDEVEHVLRRCASDRMYGVLKTLTQVVERFGGRTEMSDERQDETQ